MFVHKQFCKHVQNIYSLTPNKAKAESESMRAAGTACSHAVWKQRVSGRVFPGRPSYVCKDLREDFIPIIFLDPNNFDKTTNILVTL